MLHAALLQKGPTTNRAFCFLKSMMRLVAGDIAALDSFTLALLHAALVVALLMRVDVFCDWRT